jgi:hypothetical protein
VGKNIKRDITNKSRCPYLFDNQSQKDGKIFETANQIYKERKEKISVF